MFSYRYRALYFKRDHYTKESLLTFNFCIESIQYTYPKKSSWFSYDLEIILSSFANNLGKDGYVTHQGDTQHPPDLTASHPLPACSLNPTAPLLKPKNADPVLLRSKPWSHLTSTGPFRVAFELSSGVSSLFLFLCFLKFQCRDFSQAILNCF